MGANEDTVDAGAGDGCSVLNVGARVFAGVWVDGAVRVDELEFREEKSESRACGEEGCVRLALGRVVVEAGMNAVIMVGHEDDV